MRDSVGLLFAFRDPAEPLLTFGSTGYQFAGLLLALLTLLMAPLPFLLFYKGASIRAKSDYASATTAAPKKATPASLKSSRNPSFRGEKKGEALATPMSTKPQAFNDKQV